MTLTTDDAPAAQMAEPALAMASPTIGKIAGALAKARKAIGPIVKDKRANAGKYSYAYSDLASAVAASTAALSDNGIAVVQRCAGGELRTLLAHESGEWIEGGVPLLFSRGGPQEFGSAMTYARRYGLLAALGMAPEDDDGEAAQRKVHERRDTKRDSQPRQSAPGYTTQSKEVADLIASLKRRRSLKGLEEWYEQHGKQIHALGDDDKAAVRAAYQQHRTEIAASEAAA